MLKRSHTGIYHKRSATHLARCMADFASRHNARGLDTIHQMRAIHRGLAGKRLPYRAPTAWGMQIALRPATDLSTVYRLHSTDSRPPLVPLIRARSGRLRADDRLMLTA